MKHLKLFSLIDVRSSIIIPSHCYLSILFSSGCRRGTVTQACRLQHGRCVVLKEGFLHGVCVQCTPPSVTDPSASQNRCSELVALTNTFQMQFEANHLQWETTREKLFRHILQEQEVGANDTRKGMYLTSEPRHSQYTHDERGRGGSRECEN